MSELRGNLVWIAVGGIAVAAVTVALLYSPLIASAVLVALAVVCVAIVKGRAHYRAVALLGGAGLVVLMPPLHTPLPGWIGMAGGAAWMLLFGVLLRNKSRRGGWIPVATFSAVALLGALSSTGLRPFPFVAIVLLYLIPIALLSRGLVPEDSRVLKNGVLTLAVVEAVLCIAEFVLFRGDPLDPASGYHPVLASFTRTEGTLGHPIVAGVVMLVGVSLLLAYPAASRWRFVVLVVLLAGIFTTGSSSVYVAALVAVVTPLVLAGRIGFRIVKVALLASVVWWLLSHEELFEPVVRDVSGINSTHRLNSIQAIPNLLTLRPLGDGLFGSGWGSEQQNYSLGFLKNDYFYTVDNMFAATMMAAGLLGFALLIVFVLKVFVDADRAGRVALIPMVLMMFSFDVLQWASAGALFLIVALMFRKTAPADVSQLTEATKHRVAS